MGLASYDFDAATDAERLRAQAETLRKRSKRLREEADELDAEALEMVVSADRLTREPLVFLAPATASTEGDTQFLDRIVKVLEGAGPLPLSDLANHLGATPARARKGVLRLVEVGTVVRTGIKSGTRYELAGDDDAGQADNVRELQSYERAVRDAAVALDTFDMVAMQRHVPDIAEGTVRRWVRRLEERGVLHSEWLDGRKVYAITERPSGPTQRPRAATPEQEARTMRVGSGGPVAGTGRGDRAGVPIVDELIREVRALDPTIATKRRSHKISFMRGPWEIAHCSSTPGASSLKGTRSQLRKAGVPVK